MVFYSTQSKSELIVLEFFFFFSKERQNVTSCCRHKLLVAAFMVCRNSVQQSTLEPSCQSQVVFAKSLHLQRVISAASCLFKGNICWVVYFIKETAENKHLHKKHQIQVRGNCFVWIWRQVWQGILMPLLPCHVFHLQTLAQKPANVAVAVQCYWSTGGKWGENDNNISLCNNTQTCAAVANNTAEKGLSAHACWNCWGLIKLCIWTDNSESNKNRIDG